MLSPHYFHVKVDTAKGEIIQKTFQHGVGGYGALWVNVPIAPDTPGVSSTTRKRTTNGARESCGVRIVKSPRVRLLGGGHAARYP